MVQAIATAAALLLLASTASASPRTRRATLPDLNPVIATDFPDPSIIRVNTTWYAFASQSAFDFKNIKVQLATSPDFQTWSLSPLDALSAALPPWVDAPAGGTWAPSVSRRQDGKFLMYYSAVTNTGGGGRFHCVGAAVADEVMGPYESNSDEPFACPVEKGGALDASAFIDPVDGGNYVLYKIDANALGHGGTCGNTVPPILSTPIMIQRVDASDGVTKIGDPVEILTNTDLDGPLVEAPYMTRTKEGLYVLFFSSNCWTTELYDVSYAVSESPLGPFRKTMVPLAVTGTRGMIGPGGASVAGDGEGGDEGYFALHGYARRDDVGGRRAMFVGRVGYGDGGVEWV
ncbi:hypothetical protein CLAFUW4_03864 [Fulvia fulva]|uniref:Arabinanase/levansucrase/invertase n=1 Tax=Passalora fulva TaxID=5499 RepID=A0A9Q8P5B5_PASFU|nr:uncharacterized protein CLAFUR5_03836 [Fulvia fulva]KAK4630944.1 hypothetical protein CLAFUR4_03852 [Fulvia fulva]KAK4633278.1 hypothetical protein CLAFUR0_03851 [Fulvia fulva]UJO13754.1 hypothetical protein CLAFUR5_03836 [Fulvia fulva]WPV10572.1 hypothetical protein CLAFUW4_03864 [Fulvia fulva]WPV26615.1 hypothetical protein CLAFUW7_03856 [Fulvia fulva]